VNNPTKKGTNRYYQHEEHSLSVYGQQLSCVETRNTPYFCVFRFR